MSWDIFSSSFDRNGRYLFRLCMVRKFSTKRVVHAPIEISIHGGDQV